MNPGINSENILVILLFLFFLAKSLLVLIWKDQDKRMHVGNIEIMLY